jgi:hypothetical protein
MHSILFTVSKFDGVAHESGPRRNPATTLPFYGTFFLILSLKDVIIRNSIVNSPFSHGIEISTNVQSAKIRPRITGFVGKFMEGYHADVDLTHEIHTEHL